jgi:hypothetical protein
LGSGDTQVLQIAALIEEEGNDLASRGAWEGLTVEAVHTTTATEDQGAINTIASNGFRYIKNGTFFNRSNGLKVEGPLDAESWQATKALPATGPKFFYRFRGGKMLVTPTPDAGLTWAFEYVSKNWILGADGVTYKNYFTLDTDTVLLPEELFLMGLRWRWLREKGLDYAELFRTYEMQVKDALGRDGGSRVLSMSMDGRTSGPNVFIPSGSWAVP